MMENELEVWTIGHSTQSYESFLERLRGVQITAIADVRSSPYSRHLPHFNRDILRDELRADHIAYVFMGEELGGRPKGKQFYCDGVADYEKMARADAFASGLNRVIEGARKYKIALMCSEQHPLDCHRCLLVGRALAQQRVNVRHILSDGGVIRHKEIEEQLLDMTGKTGDDFFESHDNRLATAYRRRSMKVAYSERKDGLEKAIPAE